MFVPLSDENALRHIHLQWVTIMLVVVNCVIYAAQLTPQGGAMAASFAIIPGELFGTRFGLPAKGMNDAVAFPEIATLASYMFLHGDIWHLTGNMLFLWVFGDNVEDAMGHLRYLAFYLLCGLFAGIAHAWITQAWMAKNAMVPMIGASGAVAGVIAAYLLLHPHVRVWVVAFRVIPLNITAAWALGAWIATQFVMVAMPSIGPIAWWAHIGGILAGAVLVVFMRRPGVALLDRRIS